MRLSHLLLASIALGFTTTPSAAHQKTVLAVIEPAFSHHSLNRAKLAAIYLRERFHWSDGTKIEPVNLPADGSARLLFSRAVLGRGPQDLEPYWNRRYFDGILPPYVLHSPRAVLRFVARTRGAVGYIPYDMVDARVRVVLLITDHGRVRRPALPLISQNR